MRIGRLREAVDGLARCRLCLRITLVVFASIFVIEAVILIPSYLNYERDLLSRLEEVGRSTITAALRVDAGRTQRSPLELATAVSRVSKLDGGALYDPDGALIGTFGRPGRAMPARLDALPAPRRPVRDGDHFDVVWPAADTGLAVTVAARLDASAIPGQLVAFVWRIAGLVLLISSFVCLATIVILSRSVLTPLLTIRDALSAGADNPAEADRQTLPAPTNDEIGEVVLTLQDLLRRVAKTHREELATVLAVLDRTADAIIACDMAGRIVYTNPACIALCGCADAASLQARALPKFRVDGRPEPVLLTELLEAGAFSGEVAVVGCDGRQVPCLMNGARLADETGGTLRCFASITDISELRAANEILAQRNVELMASDRMKSEFVANMSHELRTPLNAILGFSEIMRGELFGKIGNPQYEKYIADIHDSGSHLLQVINDILDLSKIEAGKLDLKEETFDPAEAIKASIRLVSDRARSHGIALESQLANVPRVVRADARKLRQVLINLLSNAVKFTPDGGNVVVSATTDSDGALAISVADTGIGIAPEDQERVLLPFAQVDGSLARRYEGTGLGLPLAKAMVELHDGSLNLNSRPGEGTTVTVRLPAGRLVA